MPDAQHDEAKTRYETTATGSSRVLVCRARQPPVVEIIHAYQGSYLDALQSIVGGLVTKLELEDGVDMWCNDDAHGLELNWVIPAVAPALPEGFESAILIKMDDNLAAPGEVGEWRIYGDFLITRNNGEDIESLTEEDIQRYTEMWQSVGWNVELVQ